MKTTLVAIFTGILVVCLIMLLETDYSPPKNCPCLVVGVVARHSDDYRIKVRSLNDGSVQFFYSKDRYVEGDLIK